VRWGNHAPQKSRVGTSGLRPSDEGTSGTGGKRELAGCRVGVVSVMRAPFPLAGIAKDDGTIGPKYSLNWQSQGKWLAE